MTTTTIHDLIAAERAAWKAVGDTTEVFDY
jgi:hypothetical protein